MVLKNSQYDILKWIGLITVPVITFLTALVNVWGDWIPYGDQIIATLSLIDVLIGAIVSIAKVQYEKQKKLEVSEEISEESEEFENIDTVEEQNQEEIEHDEA